MVAAAPPPAAEAGGGEGAALRWGHLAVLALAALMGLAVALGLVGGDGAGPRSRGRRNLRARGSLPPGGGCGTSGGQGGSVAALLKACPAVGAPPCGGAASLLDRLAGGHPRTLAALRPAPAPRGWEPESVAPGVTLMWRRPDAPGRPLSGAEPAPVLLLLPGGAAAAAAGHWAVLGEAFYRAGWVCCAVHEATAASAAHSAPSCTRGLALSVHSVRERYPGALLAAAGFGFGANALIRYLADKGPRSKISAGFAVSPLWDLFSTREVLQRSALLRCLYGGLLPGSAQQGVEPPLGFDSWYDFHRNASAALHLRRVRRPLLCIGAADDPLVSPCVSRAVLEDAEASGDVAVWMMATGGHLGMLEGGLLEGLFRSRPVPRWLGAALEFFTAACETLEPAGSCDSPDFRLALASSQRCGREGAATTSDTPATTSEADRAGEPATPSPDTGAETGAPEARIPKSVGQVGDVAALGGGGGSRTWLTPEAKQAALLSVYAAAVAVSPVVVRRLRRPLGRG